MAAFFQNILNKIIEQDRALFHLINEKWTNAFLDEFMPFITRFKETKYILIAVVLIWVWKSRLRAMKILLGCSMAVLIADVTAAHIIKPWVNRARPEFSEPHVRILGQHHGSPSFVSNHAANSAAVATYLYIMVPAMRIIGPVLAFLISYSRPYVGAHYPADVFFGALWGVFCAWLVYRAFLMGAFFLGSRPIPPAKREKRPKRR